MIVQLVFRVEFDLSVFNWPYFYSSDALYFPFGLCDEKKNQLRSHLFKSTVDISDNFLFMREHRGVFFNVLFSEQHMRKHLTFFLVYL